MKRVSKHIAAILLGLTMFTANGEKMPSKTGRDYYIATADLNVRTGPGNEYPIFFILQQGDEVQILSRKGNWYHIRYLEKKGYAYSKYLKYNRTVSNVSLIQFRKTMPYIIIGIFVGLTFFVGINIYRKKRDRELLNTVTKSNRGTQSERDLVLKLLKYGIQGQTIFHDLYLKKDNGDFSQVDLVVILDVGIIVFEVKDYSGWIFGTGKQSQWTQVLAYGKQKYRFYNPIMQNNKHLGELRKKLAHLENVQYYSIVLFYGDCVLKNVNFVPKGTFIVKSDRILEVMKIITANNEPVHYSNKDEVVRILKEAVNNGEYIETQIKHRENVTDMLGKGRIFD